MCNPHNVKVFGTFLAALYAPDYNQPILKLSLTDFKSSENNSDLGHFKMTPSGQGGVLRDTKKVLVDTGHPLGGAGGITDSRPPCNLKGEACVARQGGAHSFAALDSVT